MQVPAEVKLTSDVEFMYSKVCTVGFMTSCPSRTNTFSSVLVVISNSPFLLKLLVVLQKVELIMLARIHQFEPLYSK